MLGPELLLNAYRHAVFPMAVNKRGDIGWFSPDPRAVIPLDERFHVPHGLRRVLKQQKFDITFDTDFESVIRACAKRKEGTWISKQILESYCALYRLGHAHSVEVWLRPKGEIPRQARNDKLERPVGGLYGVHIGGAFFGESMFHRVTDASKVALVALVERLRERRFGLLDTQWQTPHLKQFGTFEISHREYRRRLERALKLDCKF
jgi:leucyl/phenylalanyl-tRNA--protein transferase